MHAIAVDLDNTLADSAHRAHLLPDWEAFFEAGSHDVILRDTLAILNGFIEADYDIVIITGRPERYREKTMEWLSLHNISADAVYMRGDTDRRRSCITKSELLGRSISDRHRVVLAIDDDNECAKLYLEDHGVPTILPPHISIFPTGIYS